jgi:hypothetical protein
VARRLLAIALSLALLSVGYVAGSRHLLTPAYVIGADDCATFAQTGKQICGRFLQYWQANGGLAQQGLPLTNTFSEVSSVNQRTYTVQYFERAVFELHPENAPPYDVLLSLLGREKYLAKYPGGDPSGSAPPAPPPPAPTKPPSANCDPSYPTVCIPAPPPDLDCKDIPYRNFRVLPPDPHKFDSDKDGYGCES